jgi:predicted anti-sigma-YlaC factor YlaD
MDCKDLLLLISDFLDGEADPSVCREFEKHMAGCRNCRIVVNTTSRTISLYKELHPQTVPVRTSYRLRSKLRQAQKEMVKD